MTEEEKKAIKELKWYFEDGIDECHPIDIEYDLEIIFKLIEKQQQLLEEKENIIKEALEWLEILGGSATNHYCTWGDMQIIENILEG